MSALTHAVATLGRGPGRSRSLTQDEAQRAMAEVMSGTAAPEAVGALLMLLRMKGETASELAGLTLAARQAIKLPQGIAALDWPVYAAGRSRGLPWFLLSAQTVARAGHPVLLHGWPPSGTLAAALQALDIPVAEGVAQAAQHLDQGGITYLPLGAISPTLLSLLQLRSVLGLRSCLNTLCRLLNPTGAAATVQGVFHPSYRLLQQDAGQIMGQANMTVLKGGGGEFERHPGKSIAAFGLRQGAPWSATLPALVTETTRLADRPQDLARLTAPALDAFEMAQVTGTLAAALDTLGYVDAAAQAATLWSARDRQLAA